MFLQGIQILYHVLPVTVQKNVIESFNMSGFYLPVKNPSQIYDEEFL
jgi:hypothetical protein